MAEEPRALGVSLVKRPAGTRKMTAMMILLKEVMHN